MGETRTPAEWVDTAVAVVAVALGVIQLAIIANTLTDGRLTERLSAGWSRAKEAWLRARAVDERVAKEAGAVIWEATNVVEGEA